MTDKELVYTASNGDRVYVETEGLGVLVEGACLENMQQIQRAHLGAIRDLWARLKESETSREFQRQTIELQTEKVRSLSQQADSADAHARLYQDRTKDDLQAKLDQAEKALELTATNLKRSQAKVYQQIDRIKEITAQRDSAIEANEELRKWSEHGFVSKRALDDANKETEAQREVVAQLNRLIGEDQNTISQLRQELRTKEVEQSPQNMDSPAYKLQQLELRLKGHSPESLKEEIESLRKQLKDERGKVARLEVDRKRLEEKYEGFYQKTTEGYKRRDKENNRLVERIDRLEKAIAEEADRKLVAIKPLDDPQGARLIYSDGLQRCYVPVDLSAFRPDEDRSTRLKIRSRNDLLDLLNEELEKTSPEGPFSDGSVRLEIFRLLKEVIGG